MPSRMKKLLLSDPSACTTTRPSVSTPSTSKSASFTREALDSTDTSDQFCAPQIVKVDDAGDTPRRAIDDDDRCDLPLFHDVERFGGQRLRRDRDWIVCHDFCGAHLQHVEVALHVSPQVAVGDDADERSFCIDHA